MLKPGTRISAAEDLAILNSLEVIIYICDLQTHEILFANDYAKTRMGIKVGDVCWHSVYGDEQACAHCDSHKLFEEADKPVSTIYSERYNPKSDGWFRSSSRAVQWEDGSWVRLEVLVESTESVQLRNELLQQNEYYRIVLKSIGDGVIATDKEGRVTWLNPVAQQLTGWSRDAVRNRPLTEVFPIYNTLTGEKCENPVEKVLRTGKVVGLANHTSLRARDGSVYQIADSASPVMDEKGEIYGVVMVFYDVTEEYANQQKLRESEERFSNLFYNSINAIALHEMIYDREGNPVDYRFLAVNNAFQELTGLEKEQLIGRTVLEVLPGTEDYWIRKYGHVALTGESIRFEQYSRELDRYYSVRAYQTKPHQFVTVFNDITDRKRMEFRLQEQAYKDVLTNLPNRRYFEEQLTALDTEENLPLSIVLADINGLKIINDSMGHKKGDEVLRQIGETFLQVKRSQDLVARWGGDEFVMLLPRTDLQGAAQLCTRFEQLHQSQKETGVKVSLALGCSTKTDAAQDLQEILQDAENRMYQHKMANAASSRSALVASLQTTLAEKSYETEEHARHLQELALALGERIGLAEAKFDQISLVALLHDIGKVAIPESILDKPGPLTEEEWKIMRQHCEIGYRIVVSSPDLIEVAEGILAHHERWDGSGYPRGLKGEEIPLVSRIISIVDAFDAMTTDRPYKEKISPQKALEEIAKHRGTQFDPYLAGQFIALMEEKYKINQHKG